MPKVISTRCFDKCGCVSRVVVMSVRIADVAGNLDLQLSELEMLQSMYPERDELILDDPLAESDLRQWLGTCADKSLDFLPTTLSYLLKVSPDSDTKCVKIYVFYPREYPGTEPAELYLKSDSYTRESQARANRDLGEHLKALVPGELMMGSVVAWVQEHGSTYYQRAPAVDQKASSPTKPKDKTLSRLWIYSHHIYSKIKRKDILDLAPDFNLSGFCLPGKPGIMCLEGYRQDCNDAWGVIKSWNWKKINVKIQENKSDGRDLDSWRRFNSFEEIGFIKPGEARDYHMDMGEFHTYLKEHESDYMFKELFGIDKS